MTDDNDGKLPDLPDEPEVQAPAPGLVCPICALDECHHNLPYVEKT